MVNVLREFVIEEAVEGPTMRQVHELVVQTMHCMVATHMNKGNKAEQRTSADPGDA